MTETFQTFSDTVFAPVDKHARLNGEEVNLVEQVRRLVRDKIAPAAGRNDQSGEFPRDNIERLNELCLSAMFIPQAYGGFPLSFATYLMCLREISRACASTGLTWATNFHAANPLIDLASTELKGRYLRRLAEGGLAAIAITEGSGGSDATAMTTTFESAGNEILIRGEKIYITNGDVADFILLFGKWSELGRGRDAISALVVDGNTPGVVVRRKENKLGHRASSTVALGFESARVPRTNLVGNPGEGLALLKRGINRSRISFSAHSIGMARAALDDILGYGNVREVSNKKLLEYQGNQFKLVELVGELLSCENLLWNAAHADDLELSGSNVIPGLLKLKSGDVAVALADMALQLCGGAGYCCEYRAERLWRDARLAPIGEGARELLATNIGKSLARAGLF